MKLTLKNIRHSPSLSEETEAFSANVYINSTKVGYAKNSGHGGCTEVRIDNKYDHIIDKYAKSWRDELDPNPIDYSASATVENGHPNYPRISASQREAASSISDMCDCVDAIVQNYILIKDMRKIKRRASYIKKGRARGEYVSFKTSFDKLSDELSREVESEADFECWLHDLELDQIAIRLGIRSADSGPLSLIAG